MNEEDAAVDPRWFRVALLWGIIAGCASVVTTVLWAVDWFGLLGVAPEYTETAAGQLMDEATLYAASFARDGQLLWYFRARDTFSALSFLGLIPLMLAVNALVGARRAPVQVAGGFFAAAAVFGVLIAITRVAASGYWGPGWGEVAPEVTVTVGRLNAALHAFGAVAGLAASVTLAIGLGYLGAACRSEERLPRWLAPVAWVGTACSVAVLVISALPIGTGHPIHVILGLLGGIVVLPLVTIGLGVHLGRGPRPQPGRTHPQEPPPSLGA